MKFCSFILFAAMAAVALSSEYKDDHYYGHGDPYRGGPKCDPPKRPQYGGYDGSYSDYYEIGQRVTYYCDDGYNLYGPEYSVCSYSTSDNRGYWDDDTPYCKPSKKLCPKLEAPDNGAVKQTGIYPGDGAYYICGKGFTLVGDKHRTCQKDGTFSGSAPICQPIDCGSLPAPENGDIVIAPDTRFRAVAMYSCNPGFELKGLVKRQCLYDGRWSGFAPVCKPVDCGPLRDIKNGRVVVTGTSFRDMATYTCRLGFKLIGDRGRRCRSNGEWSGAEPMCQKVDCGPLSDPKNGRVLIVPNTLLGSIAVYRCKYGFTLEGDKQRVCEQDGWSGEAPTCDRESKGCGYPPPPGKYGDMHYTTTGYGSKISYSCHSGYDMEGPHTITCLANGKYSGKAPACNKRVRCKDPAPIEYGTVEIEQYGKTKRAVYHCNHGYNLVGSKVVECRYDGKYSGPPPVCEPVDCGPPDDPNEYGSVDFTTTTLHSIATYSCQHGYKLFGSTTVKCLYTGKWSDNAPICKPVDCGHPPNPNPHSTVEYDATTLGSMATYTCDHGYNLKGTATIKCQYNKKWSDVAPVCKPVDCGPLPAPKNGAVEHVPHTLLHSLAKFSCDKGFRLIGDETLKCEYDGEYSGNPPVCKRIECPKLTAPEYGEVHTTGNYPGDRAHYRCNYGYILEGSSHRVCTYRGEWTGSDPTCARDLYRPYPYDKDPHGRRPYDGYHGDDSGKHDRY